MPELKNDMWVKKRENWIGAITLLLWIEPTKITVKIQKVPFLVNNTKIRYLDDEILYTLNVNQIILKSNSVTYFW